MTTQTPTQELTGTLETMSRPNKDGQCIIEVRPDFHGKPSKFTRKINLVPDADLDGLEVGQVVTVKLRRGKLKDDGDPDSPNGYWWDYMSIARATHEEPGEDSEPAAPAKDTGYWKPRDPAERASIERQVALKAAVDYMGHLVAAGDKGFHTAHVVNAAEIFAAFIARGEVSARPTTQSAATQPTQPAPRPAVPQGTAAAPTATRFWDYAKSIGLPDPASTLQAINHKRAKPYGSIADAFNDKACGLAGAMKALEAWHADQKDDLFPPEQPQ